MEKFICCTNKLVGSFMTFHKVKNTIYHQSVLSIAAFFLARMRRTIVALAALYISTFFSVSLYAAGLSSKLQGASTPDPMVMAVITGWTVAVLLWRLYRKKVDYEWKDHI